MKKLFIFDLDNTLTESKSALSAEMADLLKRLLAHTKVAIISGGDYPQFEKHVTPYLGDDADLLSRMHYLPTTGTKFYQFSDGKPVHVYTHSFTDAEKSKILSALDKIKELVTDSEIYGPQIEDRGSQITFSALGQDAPPDLKRSWDPEFAKRTRFRDLLLTEIPEFNVSINGGTSLNITRAGMDKNFGISQLEQRLNIPISEMIFFGDEMDEGGNDFPVRSSGIDWVHVRDFRETANILKAILHNHAV
jgi:HAD superfamily hydrolase (TIGR01484 family)